MSARLEENLKAPSTGADEPAARLVEHFFRHESGRLVSVLARMFGLRRLDLVEDMVQAALLEALIAWRVHGPPQNPAAWVHTVALNKVRDALRRRETLLRIAPSWARLHPASIKPQWEEFFQESEIQDSQLRMIFACCHPVLAREDQLALALKTLCGFGLAEVARGLMITEVAAKKRLQRARRRLVEARVELDVPAAAALPDRLDAVHQCLYLLFNEGYAPATHDEAIRADLCEEAARLCHALCEHSLCQTPSTWALLALMLLHAARFESRTDAEGRLLLLEEQDRSKWDRALIERARQFLEHSAVDGVVSSYHLQAGIALAHCQAPSFAATDWPTILRLFEALVRLDPSPMCRLNRAIVLAHARGPQEGITALDELAALPALANHHLLVAARGELERRCGNLASARVHFQRAIGLARRAPDKALLARRLAACAE